VLAAAVGWIAARTAVAIAVAQAGLRRPAASRAARRAAREASTMGRSEMIFIVKARGSEIPAAHEA